MLSGHRPALDDSLCGAAVELGSQAETAGGLLIGGDTDIEGGAGDSGGSGGGFASWWYQLAS